MSTTEATQAFWKEIKKARRLVKRKHSLSRKEQSALTRLQRNGRCQGVKFTLAAHRLATEDCYFAKRPLHIKRMREAAAEYDALMIRDKLARKGGRPRKAHGPGIAVGKRLHPRAA